MLPSNPRAGRSRSVARQEPTRESQTRSQSRPRERERERERYPIPIRVEDEKERERGRTTNESGPRNQVRSQRSASSAPTNRARDARPPPPPPVPRSEYGGSGGRSRSIVRAPPASARPPPSRDSDSSTSTSSLSSSGSGSSFLDRMRQRTHANASSQSSFELDPESPKEGRSSEGARKATESGGTVKPEQESAPTDLASYGYAFWNRVATVASEWAWSGSSNNTMNEVAPSAKDSDITRVLKEYHISKAKDRSDLPDWLFDERERRVDATASQSRRGDDYDERAEREYAERRTRAPARGKGFRDIYESASSSVPEARARRNDEYGGGSGSDAPAPSRATNRLKALRDAKRQVAGRAAEGESEGEYKSKASVGQGGNGSVYGSGSGDGYGGNDGRLRSLGRARREGVSVNVEMDMGREPEERKAMGRVGLPTNPRRR